MDHYVTGATIKRLREAQGLTQAAPADKLCVSPKTVSKWETAISAQNMRRNVKIG